MTNIYTYKFTAACPNNQQTISYTLELATKWVVMVEDIQDFCSQAAELGKPYHESIADFIHAKLGGVQIITAHHHGCDIRTVRGSL